MKKMAKNIRRIAICIFCVTVISLSCTLKESSRQANEHSGAAQPTDNPDVITVFVTGNEMGALKPCGCSGGQLGGLDRRLAVFETAPQEQKMIIDTGYLINSDGEQDIIKFNIIIQAFNLLDYDLVSFNEKDLEIVNNNFGSLDGFDSILNVIAPTGPYSLNAPAKFTKTFQLNDKTVNVTVATIDVNSTDIDYIGEMYFPKSDPESQSYTVNILITNRCNPELLESIADKVPAVDCLICPTESDEPMLVGDDNQRPLAFTVGRYGRYISKLLIDTSEIDNNRMKLAFESRAVTEDIQQDQALINLYKDYQQIVKERNLLEKYPRFTLSDGLHYAGTESCIQCHQFAYVEWMDNAHADAFATLEKVGSQYDPECVICHVVGMEYESGFISLRKTPLMKDVGCEVCHGPGSKHNRDPNEFKTTITDPKTICIQCHTPDHSDDYAGNEEEKLQLIDHWTEPNDLSDVKSNTEH
jgi:hypothetical protein